MPDFDDFLRAQDPVIGSVLAELHAGKKRTHWMWFIFPQIVGLGTSAMSKRFALGYLEEARSYLDHPILGERLRDCTRAVLGSVRGEGPRPRTAYDMFGSPDDRKLHSSMTLFHRADPDEPLFRDALMVLFDGAEDQQTIRRIT